MLYLLQCMQVQNRETHHTLLVHPSCFVVKQRTHPLLQDCTIIHGAVVCPESDLTSSVRCCVVCHRAFSALGAVLLPAQAPHPMLAEEVGQ